MEQIHWYVERKRSTVIVEISNRNKVYGSANGGNTVKNENQELSDLIQKACTKLNLRGHWVGHEENRQYLYGPGWLLITI